MDNSNNNSSISIAIKSENITVPHGFFGRKGGKSEGLYASLNCSDYVGDSDEAVKSNLEIAKDFLTSESTAKLVTLKQVHSNICVEITKDNAISGIEADAMVTKEKNIAIGILTADCAPVLFFDPQKSIVGAAHAGWRGAVGGVIESTVKKMRECGSNPGDILAAVGPCIGRNSYEIDDDFKRNFSGSGECFCLVNHRIHFDLPKFCRKKLLEAGIREANIETIDVDTYANCNDYFSYRYARQNSSGICGRQLSAICLH